MNEENIDEMDILLNAESAIESGNISQARDIAETLSNGPRHFVESLIQIADEDIDGALLTINNCINYSRNPKSRDPILEARAKMIRGLARTSIGESVEGGADLRWAMDRLGVIAQGSDYHGISILNVAAWHRQQSEIIMSLATHSEIARETTHSPEIVALSRHRVASIHSEMENYSTALRHHWTAWKIATQCGIDAIAESSCLHIIDLGLTRVSESVDRIESQIRDAIPTPHTNFTSQAEIHPDDLQEAIEWITPRSLVQISGINRPDLSLIIEAHQILNIDLPIELTDNCELIQDDEVLALLQ
ncbi:MAG: hypothetical protein CMA02_05395 [Euryarchaeota archaeon]|nr:hypothetical protein [Euryarchaeota archaeon]